MPEQFRPFHESHGPGPDGLGDIFSVDAGPGLVTCQHGLHNHRLPVEGMTVGQIRSRFADLLDLADAGQAEINGTPVGDDHTVQTGQTLMFAHKAGEKGAA